MTTGDPQTGDIYGLCCLFWRGVTRCNEDFVCFFFRGNEEWNNSRRLHVWSSDCVPEKSTVDHSGAEQETYPLHDTKVFLRVTHKTECDNKIEQKLYSLRESFGFIFKTKILCYVSDFNFWILSKMSEFKKEFWAKGENSETKVRIFLFS